MSRLNLILAFKGEVSAMDSVPFRDNFWNVPYWGQIFLYFTMAVATLSMLLGVYSRIRVWRRGQPAIRFDRLGKRFHRQRIQSQLH